MGAAIKKEDSKKREQQPKDGKLVEMQMYFHFKKYLSKEYKI